MRRARNCEPALQVGRVRIPLFPLPSHFVLPSPGFLDGLFSFDLANLIWTRLAAAVVPRPSARMGHGLGSSGGKLYVHGGLYATTGASGNACWDVGLGSGRLRVRGCGGMSRAACHTSVGLGFPRASERRLRSADVSCSRARSALLTVMVGCHRLCLMFFT
jgi:hypothetical protein